MLQGGGLPPICQPEGTESREQTIREHLQSSAHQECLKAERLKKVSNVQKSQISAINEDGQLTTPAISQ